MRITTEEKSATRERILKAARLLFTKKGYQKTTTRDIAKASKIASGTLFNYFTTKDLIGEELIRAALISAEVDFQKHSVGVKDDGERLFAFVAAVLRELKPSRAILGDLLSSLSVSLLRFDEEGESLASFQFQILKRTVLSEGAMESLSSFSTYQYLSLFLGILNFWLADRSRAQEQTLAFIDHAFANFGGSRKEGATRWPV